MGAYAVLGDASPLFVHDPEVELRFETRQIPQSRDLRDRRDVEAGSHVSCDDLTVRRTAA